MEKLDNLIKYKEAMGTAVGRSLPFAKIFTAAIQDGMTGKNKRVEPGIRLFVFGESDRKILACYRTYWGSARNTENSGAMLKRMLAECMEETLFHQYERGMALFCLIVEGLPGSWQPGFDMKKRIKEKVRPLITDVEGKGGAGNSEGQTGGEGGI